MVKVRDPLIISCCGSCICCANLGTTLTLTINALYETGVIIMHQVTGPTAENRIWQSHDSPGDEGYTSVTDCDTITGNETTTTTEPAQRYGVVTCTPTGLDVVVYQGTSPGGLILFAAHYNGCHGGELCHDDPEVTEFGFGGSCIDYYGVPKSGCVTLGEP